MNKSILRLIAGAVLVTALLSRCVYEEVPEPVVPDVVSFGEDIMPIFNASCNMTSCHEKWGIAPDLSPDNAWSELQTKYINVSEPESSLLITVMDGGSMAPYSSDQDIALIIKWITDGANDN